MANINHKLSIIIPTINESKNLPLLLADIKRFPFEHELIVVDAGSKDMTALLAKIGGAKVITVKEPNRGNQLKEGAMAAKGEWLLFIHADSKMNCDWSSKVIAVIDNHLNKQYAWFFDFKINKKGILWQILELLVAIRSSLFQTPYGDQGLLITRGLYTVSGGYKEMHLMEDLDIINRLKDKTKLKRIGTYITTNARKYTNSNIITISIQNACLRRKWRSHKNIKKIYKEYYSIKADHKTN